MAKKSASKLSAAQDVDVTSEKTTAAKKAAGKATAPKKVASKKAAPKKAAAVESKVTETKAAAKKAAVKKAAPDSAPSKAPVSDSNGGAKARERSASPIQAPEPVITAKSAPKVATPQVVQSAQAGVIRPAVKRPALAPPINATALYRQDRLLRAPGPDQRPSIRRDLPTEYGETRLSVLVRDANWLFLYWEVAAETRARLGIPRGDHREQIVLRLHDMTGVAGEDVRGAVSHFDVMVTDQTSSWYVQVPAHGRRYVVELGVARAHGSFDVIARSRAVQMPRMEVSEELNWKLEDSFSEAHFQILQLSGGGTDVVGRLGASEGMVSSLQSRLFSEGSSFSGSLFSGEFASGSVGRQVFAGKDRQFWLVVDAEVIVYGATEPDARVMFMGREIKLNPDGTFGIRMALPDTRIEFPVEATSADGEETRQVCPVVTRETR